MNRFKALMQKAEENQNDYEKKHLNKINRQLEQDERRKRVENERIKRKEEAFSQFKKIAKSLPSDFQKNKHEKERNHLSSKGLKDESSINKKLNDKNSIFNTKIKKTDNDNTHNNNNGNSKINHEYKKKINSSSLSQSKKTFKF